MTDTPDSEIDKLKAKLVSLETLRDELEPASYDARKRDMEARLLALVQTDDGAVVRDVHTGGGNFIGRDQYNIRIEAGAYVGAQPQTRERRLDIYRGVLAARTGDLPLRGFDPEASDATSARSDLSLAGVYVSLNTRLTAPEREITRALAAAREGRVAPFPALDQRAAGRETEAGETRPIGALEAAVLRRSQVLLGGPGSGKSTFVNYLAHALATGDAERLQDWPEPEGDCLPILVVLRDLAAWIGAESPGRKASAALLWDFICHDLRERNLDFAAELLGETLEADRALVLLDGLDEVPAATWSPAASCPTGSPNGACPSGSFPRPSSPPSMRGRWTPSSVPGTRRSPPAGRCQRPRPTKRRTSSGARCGGRTFGGWRPTPCY